MRAKKADRPVFSSLSSLSRSAVAAVAALGVAGLVLTGTTASFADPAPAQTTFVTEGFTGTSAGSGYTLPTAPTGTNKACLTARSSTTTTATDTIPGCGGTVDADGSGALRLTSASLNQTGGVGAKQSVPITKGIDAVFDSYQYNGTADGTGNTADGIVFYLAATDPYNPAVPTQIGQLGGSLGYSSTKTGTGLAHAYLGLGLDRYGNFVAPDFEGTGCSTSKTRYPNSVTVRGPGNGTTGYCVISTTAGTPLTGSLSKSGAASRADAKVPVEIVVNPTSSSLTAQHATSVTVPGGQFAVIFTPIGGSQQILRGALPTLSTSGNAASVPASWIDPATGYPYKLTYGWVAGTGGASDIHEVNYLDAKTAAGPVPVLSAAAGGDTSVAHAGSGTYTVTPTVTSGGGTESQLIRTTTTFPAGVQPTTPTAPGTGWSCTISGQVETCDYAVDEGAPIQPGTDLPALSLPYTVSGTARSATISTVVASTDAEAVTVSQTIAVQKQPVLVTAGDVTAEHGATATLTATVASGAPLSPTAPTGTVTFTDKDSGDVLCTATVSGGVASCTVTAGSVGEHTVLVGYAGDSDHEAVTGTDRPQLTFTVTKVPTTLALAVAPTEVTYGTAATLSATGLPGGATGTLTFVSDGKTLCTTTLPVTSCPTSASLAAGVYQVTAEYSGDGVYGASTSAAATLTVDKASATIDNGTGGGSGGSGGSGGDPEPVTVTHGDTTELTVGGLPTDATGTISFVTDDGTVLCTATLPDTTCALPDDLQGGTYTVHSEYSGDDNYEPATGDSFQLVIDPEPTTLTGGGGDPVTVTHGDTRDLTAGGLPTDATGTISFVTDDGTVLCTATLPDTTCALPDDLQGGTYTVHSEYSGDRNYEPATGESFSIVIAPQAVRLPAGDPTTVTHGRSTDLTLGGLPSGATGTISFVTDDGTVLCTATLPDTSCALPDDLPGGTYTVHSVYSGDRNYEGATGAPFALVIAPEPTTLSADQTAKGHTVTLTASGLPDGATGTVTFRTSDGKVLCTVTLPDTSCTTDALGAGTHVITASYSGDASFAASSSEVTVTIAADPAPVKPAPADPAADLAHTGSTVAIGAGATLALALLAAGLVLLLARRRRAAR